MAKGNILLGQSRGSIGDIVLSRSYGQQVARARNRQPANPKTDAQILQRACLATAGKAYSAGKLIFDHSFQGRKQGAENQQEFVAKNIELLRQAYANDINGSVSPANADGRFVMPNALGAVPFRYLVSVGTLNQNLFTIGSTPASEDEQSRFTLGWYVPTAAEGQSVTIGEWLSINNINIGDIFTVVVLGYDDIGIGDDLAQSQPAKFAFIRLIREGVLDTAVAATPVASADFSLAFRVETYGVDQRVETPLESIFIGAGSVPFDEIGLPWFGAAGVIRSRDDSGERSTCYLTSSRGFVAMAVDELQWGVPSPALISSWSGEAFEFQSPLILEGGDF